MSELCVHVSGCVDRYILVLSRCVQFEAEVTCEPSGCTGVCVCVCVCLDPHITCVPEVVPLQ